MAAWHEHSQIAALAQEARTVFIQKRLLPEEQILSLARSRPLVFDFDDAIFTSPSGNRSFLAQRRVESRLRQVLSAARLVIAGNRYLAEYAGQYASEVMILPTVVDVDRYPIKNHVAKEEVVIGWIGHSVNHPYLAALADVLQEVARSFRIRLLVVSDRDLDVPGLQVENRRWSEASEVGDILDMDIGVMPLPDDPWSRGKCGLKAIQYMAAGIPVVCAAVGANVEIVRHGVDGYTASSFEDWAVGLSVLCKDHQRRMQLGLAARERVEASYSFRMAAPLMIHALSRICRKGNM
ncbi:MAG: glycosyltransferase [Pseudomonadota bacterium]